MREFIKKLNESKRELESFLKEKINYVQECREEVIKDIIECEERRDKGFDCNYNSSDIIRDYKIGCYLEDLMSEEEFDKIYELLDVVATESAMAVC